jgi:hypothetical protein
MSLRRNYVIYLNLYVVIVIMDVTCVNLDVYGTCRCCAI